MQTLENFLIKQNKLSSNSQFGMTIKLPDFVRDNWKYFLSGLIAIGFVGMYHLVTKDNIKRNPLTKAEREALGDIDFAYPEQRKFPINTLKQAGTALTFSSWPNNWDTRKKVRAAVSLRYPSLKERVKELNKTDSDRLSRWKVEDIKIAA